MLIAFAFAGIYNGLNDTVRKPEAQDGQGVPESPMKHHMPGIPNPFKTKRQHAFTP
jgi:hypothetical protein